MNKTIFDKHREDFKNEIDYHRYWKELYEKERKLRQEAEGETNIVKAVGMNSPEMKEAKKTIAELRATIERFGRENNDLYNRIAKLKEAEGNNNMKKNGKPNTQNTTGSQNGT